MMRMIYFFIISSFKITSLSLTIGFVSKLSSKIHFIAVNITDLLVKYEKSAIAVLPQVAQCLEIVQDPKGLASLIWIIGEYGQVNMFPCLQKYLTPGLLNNIHWELVAHPHTWKCTCELMSSAYIF